MIRLRFTDTDLLRSRLRFAPLWETAAAIRAITHPSLHRGWLQALTQRSARLDLKLLPALLPRRGYAPDFLTPPPTDPPLRPLAEFTRLQQTPLDVVAAEIARAIDATAARDELLSDPAAALRRVTTEMHAAWDRLIEPHWPRMREALEADIAHRAARVTHGGLEALFSNLHPDVAWTDGTLTVPSRADHTYDLSGRGLLLVPSLFTWPTPSLQIDPPWQPTLIYPARGIATLWASRPTPPGAQVELLGRSRATILAELDQPATTTSLAQRLALSPATVSGHLKVMQRAGLLTSHRVGHHVRYKRTGLGDDTVAGLDAPQRT